MVRTSKDTIKAYYNACRHRGTRLACGRGRVGSFICPFHGWRWNLDGSVKLVLDREEFVPARTTNWPSSRCGPRMGRVRVHHHGPQREPLLEYLDPIPRIFAPFQFEHMR